MDVKNLPVTYYANKYAWMTAAIFTEYLADLNKMINKTNGLILLFMDNAPCHLSDLLIFSNVTVKFLPANTTSVFQHSDSGIIRTMKAHYRKLMLQYIETRMDNVNKTSDLTKAITVLDVIMWTAKSWESVKDSTISKCFANAGFPTSLNSLIEQEEGIMDDLKYLLQSVDAELSVNQFVDIDAILATDNVFREEFEKDLVAFMTYQKSQDEESEDEVNLTLIVNRDPLTANEILNSLMTVHTWHLTCVLLKKT